MKEAHAIIFSVIKMRELRFVKLIQFIIFVSGRVIRFDQIYPYGGIYIILLLFHSSLIGSNYVQDNINSSERFFWHAEAKIRKCKKMKGNLFFFFP